MRKAKTENMAEIITDVAKEIKIGQLVSIRDFMKKVHVSSSDYLVNMLESILAYHLGRAENMLQTEGREKALTYAEKLLVPQVEHCKGYGAMVKEVPLINIIRERAMKRVEEVEDYLKDKPFIVTEKEENNQALIDA